MNLRNYDKLQTYVMHSNFLVLVHFQIQKYFSNELI